MLIEIYVIIIGIILGSFYNVLIYRLPQEITMHGRSKCLKCNRYIKWYENIPIISWIFLNGKCKGCKTPISIQYPLIEIISGIFIYIIAKRYNFEINNYYLWSNYIIISGLLILSVIDYKYKEVPDIISIPLIFISIFTLTENYDIITSVNYILTILGGVLLFKYTIELIFNKEMLGEADIIIISIIFGFLKSYKLLYFSIYISCILILIMYILYKILKKEMEIKIPFIPFLFMGMLITYEIN